MICLNCGAEMTSNEVVTKKDSITYDMCEKCGSLWLDAGQLDKMAFRVQGSIEYCEEEKDDEPEKQIKKCPRCDDFNLAKVRFLESEDIFLHHCKNCGGFWLDGGELNLIDKELKRIMPVSGKGFSDFVNNVHVPYWYKRVKKRSEKTDFQVEVMPIKGAKLDKNTADECPACKNKLNQYTIFGMNFEGCPKCKGIWLIKDELRRLKNKVEDGSLRWLNAEIENIDNTHVVATKRPCVNCKNVKMVSVIFGKSSILIDWCPKCHGMWLDRGEFEAITNYLRHELLGMHPKEIEKQAAADVRRVWSGGPETRFEELLDARAAVSALINATIFEHPALFNLCSGIARLPVR
jgi:Zn-finger nucleic acid-binding protein